MEFDIAILGGMGPQAGASYFKLITNIFATDKGDQSHPKILLYSNSKIPDRADAIESNNDSPLDELEASLNFLNKFEPSFINIACNSVHHWVYKYDLHKKFPNIISIDNAAVIQIKETSSSDQWTILGTTATTNTDFYFDTFKNKNILLNKPSSDVQLLISSSINFVKNNDIPSGIKALKKALSVTETKNFLIACTEISILKEHLENRYLNFVDSADSLAIITYLKYLNLQIDKKNIEIARKKISNFYF